MSVNTNKFDDREVDYSSYEFQQSEFKISAEDVRTEGAGENVSAYIQQDPLEPSGGLDQNEVAELVAIHRSISVEPDNFEDLSPRTQGNFEFRGVFGNDLTAEADQLFPAGGINNVGNGEVYDQTSDWATFELFNKGQTNAAIFDHFALTQGAGFEEPADGSGAGATTQTLEKTLPLREWYGAGPVLDASDNIGLNANLVSNNIDIGELSGLYRTTLVWDVAEVDDAGRRFGIPR